MIELTNSTAQNVLAGGNVAYTDVTIPSNSPSIVYTDGSTAVRVRGLFRGCGPCAMARFRVHFNGNLGLPSGGTAGAISLAIAVDGEAITSTTMTVTPAEAAEYFSVAADTVVTVPNGCCSKVSVQNISTVTEAITNANLIIERVA